LPIIIILISSINSEEIMQKGKVKFYNTAKRYGFITGDDGTDYFFHQSGLNDDIYVKDNDSVEFEVVDGDRGQKAVNISLVD